MATIKKYDLQGNEIGEISVEEELLKSVANTQSIKDYIVAIRKNKRQWSANTKGRKEVKCTKAKPFKQKGLGRARQGFLAAPQYRGGGIVFGPKPKFNQHVKINKKERRRAIQQLIIDKIQDNRIHVLDLQGNSPEKTKDMVKLFKGLKVEKRALILAETQASLESKNEYEKLFLCMRNVPKKEFGYFQNANGYDLSVAQDIIILEPAVDELLAMLGKVSEE